MSIDTAKQKLNQEAQNCGGIEKAVVKHLVEIMDDELADLVERKEYTVAEMGRFVFSKARKELRGISGGLPDEVVYGFATDYYHASREDVKKVIGSTASVSEVKKEKPGTPAAKTQQKPAQEAKKEPAKKETAAPAPVQKKKNAVPEGQMSLFDMLGGMAGA